MPQSRRSKVLFAAALAGLLSVLFPHPAGAQNSGAELRMSPVSGSVTVNETFEVAILLDTGGNTVNAIDAIIKFPPDKLQVVSPSGGQSVIGIWTSAPKFNNNTGEIRFQGGVPSPGINARNALISTIKFRARSFGTANITFSGDSKVLLNDGQGTDVLVNTNGASFTAGLAPSKGPDVISPTHQNQDEWHKAVTAVFSWETDAPASGYSYVLSQEPDENPDSISEGAEKEVSYKNLPDGFYYFHIRALRNGVWGGTSHYAVKIDASEPAEFDISIHPKARTSSKNPVLNFSTTDALSGISHYEIRIVGRNGNQSEYNSSLDGEGFFIETPSTYFFEEPLKLGDYDVIVRAYDNAGNFQESIKRMSIVMPVLTFSEKGVDILGRTVPWITLIAFGSLVLALVAYIAFAAFRIHKKAHLQKLAGVLDDPVIRKRLEELERELELRRRKYDERRHRHGIAAFLFAVLVSPALIGVSAANAQETASLPPPIITTVPSDVANDELFYVGGQTDISDIEVVVYLQNVQDGSVRSQTVKTDGKGDWFYAYPEPLAKGSYILWAQAKIGSELSPPGPQKKVNVSKTALQLGASRLSYETLYLFTSVILLIALLFVGGYAFYHTFHGIRKRKELMKEVKEAEDAIKEGFATLHRDIADELEAISQAHLDGVVSAKEEERRKRLLEDLKEVEALIKKEFRDVKIEA